MVAMSFSRQPAIGIAYSEYTPVFLQKHTNEIDYVEVPFELLKHNPSAFEISSLKPIILHCASLSIAGTLLPNEQTINSVREWSQRTKTPWLGEHLSFIIAERELAGDFADEYAPGEPYNIGYTVSPPLNEASILQVLKSVEYFQQNMDVPLLLENPPMYFRTPGSTMSQIDFIQKLCEKSSVNLILDLAHFYITSQTIGFNPLQLIKNLPLERVTEVHISGVGLQEGTYWDNHASRAPEVEFELLGLVLQRARVRAITLEYNWSSQFSAAVLLDEIARVRKVISASWTQADG